MRLKPNSRRSFLTKGAGGLAAAFWADDVLDALPQNTNTNSKPSDLKITDLRMATINGAPFGEPIIRIDTNQGISGYGRGSRRRQPEVRADAEKSHSGREPLQRR